MLPRTARPETFEAPAPPPALVRRPGPRLSPTPGGRLVHTCPLLTPAPEAERAALDDLLRQAALLRTVAAVVAAVVLLAVLVVLMLP